MNPFYQSSLTSPISDSSDPAEFQPAEIRLVVNELLKAGLIEAFIDDDDMVRFRPSPGVSL